MSTEILIAVISAAGTVCGSLGGILISNRISTYRIGELEKKVEKLNNTLDKIARIEMHLAVLEERVDTLEGKV